MKTKQTDGHSNSSTSDEAVRRQIAGGRPAEEIFRVVVKATTDAIVLTSAQDHILLVNAGVKKNFRYVCGRLPS